RQKLLCRVAALVPRGALVSFQKLREYSGLNKQYRATFAEYRSAGRRESFQNLQRSDGFASTNTALRFHFGKIPDRYLLPGMKKRLRDWTLLHPSRIVLW